MAQPPAKRIKLTALAEKYGHPTQTEDFPIAFDIPLKSGLTPIPLIPFTTIEEKVDHGILDKYQRKRFYGTMRTLSQLDRISNTW